MDSKVMFSSKTDLWATPQRFFDELKAEFGTDPRKIAATEYWDDKNVCMGRCRKGC